MTTHTGTTRTKSPRVAWNRHAASLVPYRSQDATVSVLASVMLCDLRGTKPSPVYSPKNPPEDPLTDAISQGPQGLGALVSLAETNGFSRWNHWSQFARPTAPAAGTIGLSFRDQWLQELKPLVSLAETDSSSCWENWSQFLRPMAPVAGTIGLTPAEAKDCRQLQEPRPTAPAAGPLVLAPATNGPSYWGQWSHLLRPKFSSAKTNIST
ncbi:hypothetical protein PCANC_16870 [Puccinia coronata f. sp. avenae]|uniref:Uncharacterized protein n=1 Tax=Puccinia coronata f. sp. avenae TaxID=200324 RepID=A0A2N5SHS0_9BASI|nr:hypothetical protein PCANC_16870 [Puccinia coronata f. sp. avenae]